ncbi:hypothetical protein EDD15DRAFT_2192403 [Pisolithus albus]|nr:hypothetical protein EDD15DRAFT_2192403 [Pisolithus albus]
MSVWLQLTPVRWGKKRRLIVWVFTIFYDKTQAGQTALEESWIRNQRTSREARSGKHHRAGCEDVKATVWQDGMCLPVIHVCRADGADECEGARHRNTVIGRQPPATTTTMATYHPVTGKYRGQTRMRVENCALSKECHACFRWVSGETLEATSQVS